MTEPKMRILIAEDEALVAMDLKSRLEAWGHEVIGPAATADEALDLARQHKPDLVLLDIRLQGRGDGTEVAAALQGDDAPAIVFLTANADTETVQRAKATQPHGFLLKPFRDRDLQVALEIALYKREAERRIQTLLTELQQALAQVKKLSGLLPICARCHKIRDDSGYWNRVEAYIQDHSEARFSHSLCPDCAVVLYPDLFDEKGEPRDPGEKTDF